MLLVSGATRWNFERGFLGYLNELAVERMDTVLPRLTQAYAQHRDWAFLGEPSRPWYKLLRPGPDEPLPPGGLDEALPPDLTGALSRLGLLDDRQRWVAGYRSIDMTMQHRAVVVDGRTVGWLVLAPFQSVADGGDQRFAIGQWRTTLVAALVAVLLAGLIAWWVSHRLLAPVKQIAAATHQLTRGQHDVRVPVHGSDEVAQLGRDFNRMAQTLARNEEARRAFMADVSHELRTPLAVLRGELEALEDGIRPLNQAAVSSLQGEVRQLGKLVDDLYDLALSDVGALTYHMEPVDLVDLVGRTSTTHARSFETAGLQFTLKLPDSAAAVEADPARLQQLFDNLLSNSRLYTETPGQVTLALSAAPGSWQIEVQDSPPGLPIEQLAQLFERFFRGENSRNRATGGAGLGLAIARNIVAAHGGQIEARPSPLGGVSIRVKLPRLETAS
ncbi:ATP-binding protein [Variovorax sp. WS11]|uniref:ATP-binding protein n=1 Tax=Variovorax sp. WS11 TaxID=1105204 RepID=UPI002158F78F|nr:ATP-binding protein [Variovorax sp. WS11]